MTFNYKATSLEDIAASFDELHNSLQRRAGLTVGLRKKILVAEARTWLQAADMLRRTKLEEAK